MGILSNNDALELAENAGLDLVEVSPNADPPVCRVMDFGKFQYELKKQKSDARKKQKKTHVKMIKYRGREVQHRELGMEMLDRIESETEEFATVEQKAKMEGRQLGMMLAPKSKKSKAKARKVEPEEGQGVNDAEVKDQ